MKAIFSIITICTLVAGNVSAQTRQVYDAYGAVGLVGSWTIHAAAPGTKGNTVELTVVNGSRTSAFEDVHIRIARHSLHLTFASNEQAIRSIPPARNAAVTLAFDVARSAPVNVQDTLEFLITDNSGLIWTKSVIIRYTGPTVFALDQNFPNPFNPSTTIQYQLPVESRVSLKLYDMLGREVATLVNEDRPAGYHEVRWIASNAASGVYFYRLEAQPLNGGNRFQSVRRLMVLK